MQQGDSNLARVAIPLFTREDFTLLQRARLVEKYSSKQPGNEGRIFRLAQYQGEV
jgi:hypothetical protein